MYTVIDMTVKRRYFPLSWRCEQNKWQGLILNKAKQGFILLLQNCSEIRADWGSLVGLCVSPGHLPAGLPLGRTLWILKLPTLDSRQAEADRGNRKLSEAFLRLAEGSLSVVNLPSIRRHLLWSPTGGEGEFPTMHLRGKTDHGLQEKTMCPKTTTPDLLLTDWGDNAGSELLVNKVNQA